MYVLII